MNRRALAYLAGFCSVALLGWLSGQVLVLRQSHADETPAAEKPAAKPCDVAVIDIGKVFKEHIEFKKAMDLLKAEMVAFQEKGQARHKELQDLAEAAKSNFKKGSEPLEQEERKLQRLANELQIESASKQKQIMAEEAKVYHRIYNDVSEKTIGYARAKGIRIVLRFNSDSIDPDDRNSVLAGVNNSIVYQDNLDITDEIIRRVNNFPNKS